MLGCVGSISHFTPYKHIENLNKNIACSNHVAFEIYRLNCEWVMLNCRSWISDVKTSNNSKQQCCKQEFEF